MAAACVRAWRGAVGTAGTCCREACSSLAGAKWAIGAWVAGKGTGGMIGTNAQQAEGHLRHEGWGGQVRTFAAAPVKKGKFNQHKKEKQRGMISVDTATGINYEKNGLDPKLRADDAYPAWLWGLLEEKKSMTQLEEQIQSVGDDGDPDLDDVKRLFDLASRKGIKDKNSLKKK